jgi:hypothetical protein
MCYRSWLECEMRAMNMWSTSNRKVYKVVVLYCILWINETLAIMLLLVQSTNAATGL